MGRKERNRTKKSRAGHRISSWKRSLLLLCAFLLVIAGLLHCFRLWKTGGFEDQQEASRWSAEGGTAQVSAYLAQESALREEEIRELEYRITQALAQDSIELASDNEDGKLWEDCYSAQGSLNIEYGGESMEVSAVGTGGEYFLFHPLTMLSGSYYDPDSLMKDEVLIDEETAWKLFGSYDVVGRTLQIGDMAHTICGVFRKEEGTLYEEAGEPAYLVYVHYKSLLQFDTDSSDDGSGNGNGTGTDTSDSDVAEQTRIGSRNAGTLLMMRDVSESIMPRTATSFSEGPADDSGSESENSSESDGTDGTDTDAESISSEDSASENAATDNSGIDAASDASGEGSSADENAGGTGSEDGGGDVNGNTGGDTGLPEGTGTSNTEVTDTGRITEYQIVMPNPVEGYAAQILEDTLGEDRIFKVVDNTDRYSTRSLLTVMTGYVTRGMRREAISYPYWENYAVGWEDICVLLLLTEWLLCLLSVLLLIIMGIHYVRHKTWTFAGNLRNLQDEIYERQSRKRYPDYYEEHDSGGNGENGETSGKQDDTEDEKADEIKKIDHYAGRDLLRPAGTEREEEVYEKTEEANQYSDSGGTGTLNDSVRKRDKPQ